MLASKSVKENKLMIDEIKNEIEFLKAHDLETKPWKETAIELIKRLTADINITNETQRKKLIEEVRDFVIKGGGNDDSFDFIFQEDDKFFREVHVYHYHKNGKNKVKARIDRTILGEDRRHVPFENFITLTYIEAEDETDEKEGGSGSSSSGGGEKLAIEDISILGTKYVPFPSNLVFAEHMFSNIAGDIVNGLKHKKDHYRDLEEQIISEIPDIYATPEQKSQDKRELENSRYKIWDKKTKTLTEKIRDHDDLGEDIVLGNLIKSLRDVSTEDIKTEGLSKEQIFKNLVNRVHALQEEDNEKLLRQAKEFFDPSCGNDSFNMTKQLKNGKFIYEIEQDRANNKISASVDFAEKKNNKRNNKAKTTEYFRFVHILYEPKEDDPDSYECTKLIMFGKVYSAVQPWLGWAEKFYNYLMFELSRGDSNVVDLNNLDEAFKILENPRQHYAYIGEERLEESGVLLGDRFEDAEERFERLKREELEADIKAEESEKIAMLSRYDMNRRREIERYTSQMIEEKDERIKKKYESLYKMDLTL